MPPGEAGRPQDAPRPPSRTEFLAIAALVAAAGAVRVAASFNDLHLDEIWSIRLAEAVRSPLDVVTAIHSANNHYLNTLWLWLLGPLDRTFFYRLPSVVAGTVSVWLAWALGRRHGRVAGAITAWLAASSYLLVQYSSEARGYATAALATLACVAMLERRLVPGARRSPIPFVVAAVLGELSHHTFFFAYGAMLVWSAWALLAEPAPLAARLRRFAALHALPCALFAALRAVDRNGMVTYGGEPWSTWWVAARTLSLALGGPFSGGGMAALDLLGVGLAAAGVWAIARQGGTDWTFFSCVLLVVPVVVLHHLPWPHLYERYLLCCVVCLLLLLGRLLALVWERGVVGKASCTLALVLYTAGNGAHMAVLLRDGRGRFREALAWMAAAAPGETFTVGSDFDFRNRMVIDYHWPALRLAKRLDYVERGAWPAAGPQWVIHHALATEPDPPVLAWDHCQPYVLARTYRSAPLSGWNWFVYGNPRLAPRR